MSIELWLGREYEHTHEMKSLGHFLTRMEKLYGQDDNLYLILANFFCQGEEIDLVVLKRNGIIIVELKEADGSVVGRENGPWTATRLDGSRWQINDKRRRNPFQQVRAYRFAMIDQLKQDAPQFLPSQKARQMRLDHVAAVVTLCPTKHPDTDIQIGQLKWFSVVGLDELPQEVYYQRSPSLNFRKSELRKLAEVWGLRQYPLSRFVSGLAAELPSVQGPTRVPSPHIAEAAVATQPPALMRPTSALAQWLGLEKGEAVEEAPCLVCIYSPRPCQVPCLRGAIRRVLVGAEAQAPVGQLEILQQDGEPVTLALLPPWTRLLPQVTKVLAQLESGGEDRGLTLAAYHLARQGDGKLVAGPDSLVILEPDWLINVTDLTKIEYCPRQYLTGRFQLVAPNLPLVRGSIVHRAFEQMVKTPHDEDAIVESLKQAFREQARDMALLNYTKRSMWNEVKTHYGRLKRWVRQEQLPKTVRSETFLLTPQLGMKGKIDALWSRKEASLFVGELKTGRSYGGNPRPGHAFQVGAYSLMALIRGRSQLAMQQALVLYSGNKQLQSSLNIKREVALTPETFRYVACQRNFLVLIDYLADAPFETKQPNKCRNCTIARECEEIAVLLQHNDPRSPELQDRFDLREQCGEMEWKWFQTYATLLAREYRAVKNNHAALWRMSPEERCDEGTTVAVTDISAGPTVSDSGRYVYMLQADNRSELREEDYVLVSDAKGPTRGWIAQGVIKRPLENGLEIEFSKPLEFKPKLVDRYVSENLVERQFAGPYLWMRQSAEYRDLVIRNRTPRFTQIQIPSHHPPVVGLQRLNTRQQQAVQMALQMEDYLLIHGPPGSGKTMLIVAIVRELMDWDKRILLAAGTNTAVDNMLTFLKEAGFGNHILRLGSVNRTAPTIRGYVPKVLAKHEDLDTYIQQLRHVLTTRPIVAATATNWLSGTWDGFLQFDVAIVDEAAQLTLPATLGPLRLARQFILAGDHKQLPAVVLSESQRRISEPEADDQPRLSESLFEQLYAHLEDTSLEGIVKLNEQYRMNEEICAIPRRMWYDEDLRPGTAKVAMARLALMKPLSCDHHLFAILDPECPVVFVDVPWTGETEGPRTNRREAELIRDILQAYIEHGLSMDSIGVIAPFRAQVATIRRILETAFPGCVRQIRGTVDTVDRFQGQERELIIISLATYESFVHELLQDERRLNVALTRAKHKLIILGDISVLSAHPTYYSLIRHCTVIQSKRL